MAKVAVHTKDFKEQGDIELPIHFLEEVPSQGSIFYALKNELNNKRQGNASTKTMSEVAGSGKKPYRQKGTGRARAGSRKSPLWRGGGVIFGPHPRDYYSKLPTKMKQKALRSVLTELFETDRVRVMEDLVLSEYKTKTIADVFSKIDKKRIVWVISATEKSADYIHRSAKNLSILALYNVESLELKDIFYADMVVFSVSAIEYLKVQKVKLPKARLATEEKSTVVAEEVKD